MRDNLKPCPFCGMIAHITQLKGGKFPRYSVCCSNSKCFASESSCFGKKILFRIRSNGNVEYEGRENEGGRRMKAWMVRENDAEACRMRFEE